MVTITKNSFKIEVKTGFAPEEDYVETMKELIDSLQREPENEELEVRWYMLELLKAMLPDVEQAKTMVKTDNEAVEKLAKIKRLTCV